MKSDLPRIVRLAAHAYPRRWRAARGAELADLLGDVLQPGRRLATGRVASGLLWAGLITRVRSHPPIWPWLLYRLRDHPLPDRWAGWAYDDITGRGWLLRSQFVDHLLSAAIVLLFGHTVWPKFALTWFLVVWPAVVLLLCALTNRRATRDNALLRHGFGESGPRPSRWAASAEER